MFDSKNFFFFSKLFIRKSLSCLLFFSFSLLSSHTLFHQKNAQAIETQKIRSKSKSCKEATSCMKLAKTLHASSKGTNKDLIELLEPYIHDLDLPSLLLLEEVYSKEKNYKQQIKTLNWILSQFPEKPLYYFRLAQVQLTLNKEEQKETQQRKIKKKTHLLPKDHLKLLLQRENKAIENLRQSIELDPKFRPAYQELINLFIKKNESYEALVVTQDMGKNLGKNPSYFGLLCQLYSMRRLFEDSLENCNKAIEFFPENPLYHFYRIQVYSKQEEGQEKKVVPLLTQWSHRFPKNSFVQEKMGQYYLKKKSFPLALRHLSQSIKIDPSSASAQLAFAEASFALQHYKQALKAYLRVCDLTKKTPREFKRAASSLRQKKDKKKWSHEYNLKLQNCLIPKAHSKNSLSKKKRDPSHFISKE